MAVLPSTPLRIANMVALLGVTQFVVCVQVAVNLYPRTYDHSQMFLSLLGCDRDGHTLHAWVFNLSLALLATCLSYLFATLTRLSWQGPIELLVVGGCGFCSSICVFAVAALPYRTFPESHQIAMMGWVFWQIPTMTIWMEWVAQLPGQNAVLTTITSVGRLVRLLALAFPFACMFWMGPLLQKLLILGNLFWVVLFSLHLAYTVSTQEIHTGLAGRDRKRTPRKTPPPGTFDGFH